MHKIIRSAATNPLGESATICTEILLMSSRSRAWAINKPNAKKERMPVVIVRGYTNHEYTRKSIPNTPDNTKLRLESLELLNALIPSHTTEPTKSRKTRVPKIPVVVGNVVTKDEPDPKRNLQYSV